MGGGWLVMAGWIAVHFCRRDVGGPCASRWSGARIDCFTFVEVVGGDVVLDAGAVEVFEVVAADGAGADADHAGTDVEFFEEFGELCGSDRAAVLGVGGPLASS